MRIQSLALCIPLSLCLGLGAEESNIVKPSLLTVKERVEILRVIAVASKKEIDESVEATLDTEVKEILEAAKEAEHTK